MSRMKRLLSMGWPRNDHDPLDQPGRRRFFLDVVTVFTATVTCCFIMRPAWPRAAPTRAFAGFFFNHGILMSLTAFTVVVS